MTRKPSANPRAADQARFLASTSEQQRRRGMKGWHSLRRNRERDKAEARIDAVLDAITFPEDEL